MRRVEHSAEIAAPADEVFAYVSDIERLPEWQAGVMVAERTSDGPIGVGSTARVVRALMGQQIEAPLTVTTWDPPRAFSLSSSVQGVEVTADLVVAPAGNGSSRVNFAMEIKAGGMMGFMEPMIASAAQSDIGTSLERIRARLDGKAS